MFDAGGVFADAAGALDGDEGISAAIEKMQTQRTASQRSIIRGESSAGARPMSFMR